LRNRNNNKTKTEIIRKKNLPDDSEFPKTEEKLLSDTNVFVFPDETLDWTPL
jgi:hypothetical protein